MNQRPYVDMTPNITPREQILSGLSLLFSSPVVYFLPDLLNKYYESINQLPVPESSIVYSAFKIVGSAFAAISVIGIPHGLYRSRKWKRMKEQNEEYLKRMR